MDKDSGSVHYYNRLKVLKRVYSVLGATTYVVNCWGENIMNEKNNQILKLKSFLYRIYKQIKPVVLWIPFVLLCLLLVWNFPNMNGNYTLKEVGRLAPDSDVSQPVYSYYLDRSPSMQGFMNSSNGTMDELAMALTDVNQRNGDNNRFFFCDSSIRTEDTQVFYNCLQNGDSIGSYYDSFSVNGDEDVGLSTEGISEDILRQELEGLNLSNLFIYPTVDGYRYENEEKNVNIIITDLNFFLPSSGIDRHDQLLDEFLRQLAEQVSSSNICIYHLESGFYGARDDAFADATQLEIASAPYFVIVLAQNVRAFETYLEELENSLSKYELTYSDKFVMKTNPSQGSQVIAFDEEAFFDSESTVRSGFNFANGLLKPRSENVIGLQLLEGQDGVASLRLPMMALHELLPGIVTQSDSAENSFDVRISFARPGLFDLHHIDAPDLENVSSCRAYVSDYHGTPYLFLDFSTDSKKVPKSWVYKNYYVADIQLFMRKIVFSTPSWVEELSTIDGMGSDGKVRGLNDFFQQLLAAKGEDYARLPENQRYLGSVAIYVSYN